MDFLTELNEQADKVFDQLILAKRSAKTLENGSGENSPAAAYQRGRAVELEKWYKSLEEMIEKIIARKEAELKKRRAELEKTEAEREEEHK